MSSLTELQISQLREAEKKNKKERLVRLNLNKKVSDLSMYLFEMLKMYGMVDVELNYNSRIAGIYKIVNEYIENSQVVILDKLMWDANGIRELNESEKSEIEKKNAEIERIESEKRKERNKLREKEAKERGNACCPCIRMCECDCHDY